MEVFNPRKSKLSPVEQTIGGHVSTFLRSQQDTKFNGPILTSVRMIELPEGKHAYILYVVKRQFYKVRALQERIVDDLEKKLGGPVMLIADRRTNLKQKMSAKGGAKTNRTAMRDAMLHDLVHPHIVAGKRLRLNADQSSLLKVFLTSMDTAKLEDKLKIYSTIFGTLTNQRVEFLMHQ
uniref:40S ribosomal protein S7 n=1 Tax=Lygus hesperus TaxID=30085 RepID=A0A0A9WZA6_LYGHE